MGWEHPRWGEMAQPPNCCSLPSRDKQVCPLGGGFKLLQSLQWQGSWTPLWMCRTVSCLISYRLSHLPRAAPMQSPSLSPRPCFTVLPQPLQFSQFPPTSTSTG